MRRDRSNGLGGDRPAYECGRCVPRYRVKADAAVCADADETPAADERQERRAARRGRRVHRQARLGAR